VHKVDTKAAEDALVNQFYIRQGTQIQFVTHHKTFVKAEPGGSCSALGHVEAMDVVYEVHVEGGGVASFGKKVALKNMCSGKFLGAENGHLKHDRNSFANGAALFQLFNADNLADHSGIKDFALVGVKSYEGRWMTALDSGDVSIDHERMGANQKFRIAKLPHSGFGRGTC